MAHDRAPYVSIAWMRNYLQRIRRSAATVLDKEVAGQMGATGNNWTQLLRAARELGLVDEEGRLTEEIGMEVAAGGRRATEAARRVVERTYPSLVARLHEPLEAEALKVHFYDVSRRGRGRPLGESACRQAVALLRFWVEQSGDETWLTSLRRSRPARANTAPPAHAPRRAARRGRAPGRAEAAEPLEETIEERMPFYRVVISVPAGRRLSADEWEFLRRSLSEKIEFLKAEGEQA